MNREDWYQVFVKQFDDETKEGKELARSLFDGRTQDYVQEFFDGLGHLVNTLPELNEDAKVSNLISFYLRASASRFAHLID